MRKRILLITLFAALIAVAALCAMPAKATEKVIYISDAGAGTGDGSSPENAMGNTAAWQSILDANADSITAYAITGSALYQAFLALKETGGTIVVCDDVTVAYGVSAGSLNGSNDFWIRDPITDNSASSFHQYPITITSYYDGVDYRTSGAEFIFRAVKQSTRLHLLGDTTFENLNITCVYATYKNSNNATVYLSNNLVANGYRMVLGDGLAMRTTTDVNHASYQSTPTSAALPKVYGAKMWGSTPVKANRTDAVDLTIRSGSYYTVGASQFPSGAKGVQGDVNINLYACTIYNNVTGGYESSLSTANGGYVNGDVNITFNGTTVKGVVFGTTSVTSSSAGSGAVGYVNGDLNITINPGTTLSGYVECTANYSGTSVAVGRIGGNANVTVNATDPSNPVSFKSIQLGRQGFVNSSGQFIVKVNGDNWNSTDYGYYNTTSNAYTIPPTAFFATYLGNWTGSYKNMTLDFSGMTYNEFWAHVNHSVDSTRGNSFDTPLYQNFYYNNSTKIVPTVSPAELAVAQYGSTNHGNAAYTNIIEPTDVVSSITSPARTFKIGQSFSLDGVALTFTAQSGTTFSKTVGTDVAASDFSYTDPGPLTVANEAVEITYLAAANAPGGAVVFSLPLNITDKELTGIEVTTPPTTTTYTAGQTFSSAGLVVTASYDNGTSEVVDNALLSGLPNVLNAASVGNSAGEKTITVSYTAGGVTETATFNIYVNDAVSSLAVNTATIPSVVLNDTHPDFSSMLVTANYVLAGEDELTGDALTYTCDNTISNTQLQNKRVNVTASLGGQSVEFYAPVVSDVTVPSDHVLYVSATGTGDGSPASPLGFDANYPQGIHYGGANNYLLDNNNSQISACVYQGSPLYRAIYALSETGGRIVIVGEASFGPGGNRLTEDFISYNSTGNIYMPTWENEIEITGLGDDAILSYDARLCNPRWQFSGPVNIHGVKFAVDYSSGSNGRPDMAFGGQNSTFDVSTGMIKRVFTLADGAPTGDPSAVSLSSESAHDPVICAGKMWSNSTTQNRNATFNLIGGTWHQVHASGNVSPGSVYTQTGDITVTLTGVTLVSNFYGSMAGNYAKFAGNVTLVINDGCTFGNYIMFSYQGFTSTAYTYRVVLNAVPSLTFAASSMRTFWTNSGSQDPNLGYRENLILDMSGMDYDDFYANKATLNQMFYRWDDSVTDEIDAPWGASVSEKAGFKTVIAPSGIRYVGTSIRVTGNMGIRFKFTIPDYLMSESDFTFGVLVGKASNFSSTEMTLDSAKTNENPTGKAIKTEFVKKVGGSVTTDRWFEHNSDGTTAYMLVLTDKYKNWSDTERTTEYMVRPYTVTGTGDGTLIRYGNFLGIKDTAGNVNYKNVTSGLTRSIRYVAKQAQAYYATTAYADAVNALAAD